jgi:hypothetical protein
VIRILDHEIEITSGTAKTDIKLPFAQLVGESPQIFMLIFYGCHEPKKLDGLPSLKLHHCEVAPNPQHKRPIRFQARRCAVATGMSGPIVGSRSRRIPGGMYQ